MIVREISVIVSMLSLALLSSGCASSTSSDSVAHMRPVPLIIKVKSAEDEATLRARLPSLAKACALDMEYQRPMSGGAHVVNMRTEAVERGVDCLREQPEVVYVQEDKVARPMTGGAQ